MYNAELETIAVTPQGREELAFSYSKPLDWQSIAIPHEEPNFDDPKYFLPVAVATAMYGIGVFSVGVRPAFEDGTVREWLEWICGEDNIMIEDLREVSVGQMRGYIFDARQATGVATMVMRNLYVEDGGRLYAVCAMAAEQIFDSMQFILAEMTESFRLAEAHGPTVKLAPAPAEAEAAIPQTLDPENEINRNLRDSGAGLVPRVVAVNGEENYAVVTAGAIAARIGIPAEWHAIDDGRRTLVFHPALDAQINLDRRIRDGATDDEILEGLRQTYERQYPGIEALRLELDGMEALAFRNYEIDGESVEQVFVLRATPQEEDVLFTRVTAPEGQMTDVLNAAEVVLARIEFDAAHAA